MRADEIDAEMGEVIWDMIVGAILIAVTHQFGAVYAALILAGMVVGHIVTLVRRG